MKISFTQLKGEFHRILLNEGFSEEKAELCATIFAENSRDGVYSHGVNRFPVFVQCAKEGAVDIHAEPTMISQNGLIEYWTGNLAPGMYTATKAMDRAITLAKENGLGCVAVKNTNHRMRGGTYGWQAANAGCIGICATNTIANLPPWGGLEPRLGNNPLVIAVPRNGGHLVLDMAISQFSYGKLQEYHLKGSDLPVFGGYDQEGKLTVSPAAINASQRALPIGFWKGSGLSFMIDVLTAALSGGRTTAEITASGKESGVSQFFLCIQANDLDQSIIETVIEYAKSSAPVHPGEAIFYPGEKTKATRERNDKEGIPVNDEIWQQILNL